MRRLTPGRDRDSIEKSRITVWILGGALCSEGFGNCPTRQVEKWRKGEGGDIECEVWSQPMPALGT